MVEAIKYILLIFFYQRNQQSLLGFLHPGKFVFGEAFYGLVPLLVAESGLSF
jgi:hypothetical protein